MLRAEWHNRRPLLTRTVETEDTSEDPRNYLLYSLDDPRNFIFQVRIEFDAVTLFIDRIFTFYKILICEYDRFETEAVNIEQ